MIRAQPLYGLTIGFTVAEPKHQALIVGNHATGWKRQHTAAGLVDERGERGVFRSRRDHGRSIGVAQDRCRSPAHLASWSYLTTMSRFAEVIVIAKDAEHVMEPFTRPDPDREWHQCFTKIGEDLFSGTVGAGPCFTWVIQFWRHNWYGLLGRLESLPWPCPHSVQVLIRDEEDSCFGLWMLYDGRMREVLIPRTERQEPGGGSITGVFRRTDCPDGDVVSDAELDIIGVESDAGEQTWAVVGCRRGTVGIGTRFTRSHGSGSPLDRVISAIERDGEPAELLDAPHSARVLLTGTGALHQHQVIQSELTHIARFREDSP